MYKNRAKIVLIFAIVLIILTNYEKAVGVRVVGVDRAKDLGKDVRYEKILFSYGKDVPEDYIEALRSAIEDVPGDIVEDLINRDIRIVVRKNKAAMKEMKISGKKEIVLYSDDGADVVDICEAIVSGYKALCDDGISTNKVA